MSKAADNHQSMFRERLVMPYRRPSPFRVITWMVALFLFSLLGWSFVAKVPEVARTRGQVEPRGDIMLVQSLEGGQIVDMLVHEGQAVDKGQPLVRFEPLKTETDVNQLRTRIVFLGLEAERLDAFVKERDPKFGEYKKQYSLFVDQQEELLVAQRAELRAQMRTFDEQLLQKKQTLQALEKKYPVLARQLKSSTEVADIYEKLAKKKVASRLEQLNAEQRESEFLKEMAELRGRRRVLDKEILEVREKQESVRQNIFADAQSRRASILSDLAEARQRLKERETTLDRLLIVSPAKGIIKSLQFTNRGAVVNPSEVIAEIVPIDVDLVVEVQVSPRDIGFVHVGQPVTIRIDTYDYSRYGVLEGELTKLSPTTFTGPNGELYYVGEVTPAKGYLGNDPKKSVLLPGMTAEVDIITGVKTVFQYLLKPVFTLVHKGFQER